MSNQLQSPSLLHVTMLGLGLEVMGGIASVERLILEHCPEHVEIKHISIFEYGSPLHKVRVFCGALVRLIHRLLSSPVDVIHLHIAQRGSVWRALILIWLCKFFKKPLVLHAHGSEFRAFFDSLPSWGKALIIAAFKQAERFIVLSDSWQEFYTSQVKLRTQRVVVLLNPVQIPAELPSRSVPPPVQFIFLGRIGQRKGAFDLIQAISELPDDIRAKCHVTMAGDGEVDKARQDVAELGISDSVTVFGWVDADKRDELLAASHAFILPSYNEGLPMALLEAMGWGLASIATPVGGIPEILIQEENGLLVEPGDIDDIKRAIARLVKDSALRTTLAENARKSVQPLDILSYKSRLFSIYKDALLAK